MKYVLFLLTIGCFLLGCSGSRKLEGHQLLSRAVKALKKDPGNAQKRDAVVRLYEQEKTRHENAIEVLLTLTDESKYEKLIREYQALQALNGIILGSFEARDLITPEDYSADIAAVREQGAAVYYNMANELLEEDDVSSARRAYQLYSKVNSWVPGYRDVRQRMTAAREQGILNIVINPVTDQSVFYRSMGANSFGNSFNSDMLQRSLVRDLGGDFSKNNYARFYTDWEARRADIPVDWIVDLMWTDLTVPRPQTRTYSRNISREIPVGKDTTGKPVYETVTGTLYVTEQYFNAYGQLESRVTDAWTRNNINLNRYSSNFNWKQTYATYRGDPRALTSEEKAMIANVNFQVPTREMVLDELFREIYPQVRNNIQYLVRRE